MSEGLRRLSLAIKVLSWIWIIGWLAYFYAVRIAYGPEGTSILVRLLIASPGLIGLVVAWKLGDVAKAAPHRAQTHSPTASDRYQSGEQPEAAQKSVSSQAASAGTKSMPWLQRFASAPDFMISKPKGVVHIPGYLVVHVKDVRPLAARLSQVSAFPLRYLQALVIISEGSQEPKLFVTLEQGISATPFLCVFRSDGSRTNLGDGSAFMSDRDFLRQAASLANSELGLGLAESHFS
jgi:hypothetical protein